MTHLHRVLVLTTVGIAIAPGTARLDSAQLFTPVPPTTLATSLDNQTTKNASCVARCEAAAKPLIAEAGRMAAANEYYSVFNTNCWSLKGAPECAAIRATCYDGCAPKFEKACMARCEPPFQSCCAANDVTRWGQQYNECVDRCSDTPTPPQRDVGVQGTVRDALDGTLGQTIAASMQPTEQSMTGWEARMAAKPPVERAADDARRLAAFNEVRADLAKKPGVFAMVSGGGGRLWILRASGAPLLVPVSLAAYLRGGLPDGDEAMIARDLVRISQTLQLSREEASQLRRTIELWDGFGTGFKSGQVLTFRPGISGAEGEPVKVGSSEHSSIRGTINGGGDFI